MAQVVNASTIKKRMDALNWPFQIPDVSSFLSAQSIPPMEFLAYLDACVKSGDGVDDAAISGCTPANGAKITTALRSKGIML